MNTDANFHEQNYRYFLQEALELLQVIEQELFNLREGYSINKVYTLMRATHTLKGAAASVGLEMITSVAHSLEDVFRAICKPDTTIDSEVEALLFESYECLRLLVTADFTSAGSGNEDEILDRTAVIFASLQEKLGECFSQESSYIPSSEELGFDMTQSIFEVGVTQRLDQLATVLANGNLEQVAVMFKTQAQVFLGLGESLNLPGFRAIAQTTLTALDKHPEHAITIARIALANFREARAAVLNGDRSQGGQPSLALQQLSLLSTDSALEGEQGEQEEQEEQGEQGGQGELWISGDVEQGSISPFPSNSSYSSTRTVRVNVDHLEQLNYLIGELLTSQNRSSLDKEQLWSAVRVFQARLQQHQQLLNQLQHWFEHKLSMPETLNRHSSFQRLVQSLLEDAVQLEEASDAVEMFARQSHETVEKQRRLLTDTHDTLMEARMLPLEHLFQRFPRILQQLEFIYKKQVMLVFHGSETLVDKAVVEKLYDPLLHLVRNAFDHGIESPTIRKQKGKPEKGEIEINAYHQGRYLVVEVRDDGQGLDVEKIRAAAVERHVLSPEQASSLNQAQLIDLIFEPGFSTASQVNDLSGRGIGLDVVRTHLEVLQGSVTVYFEPHQGTTFRLQIPLSLTIAKLLLCNVNNRTYALFIDVIEEILIPTANQIQRWEGGKVLRWSQGNDTKLIPIYQLAKVLNYFSPITQSSGVLHKHSLAPTEQMMPVILIHCQDKLLGIEVDQLLAEQELVIRPFGAIIAPPSYIYGGSILPDGRLALVLDGVALMEYLSQQQSDNSISNYLASSKPHYLNSKLEESQLLAQSRADLPALPHQDLRKRPNKTILLVDDSITVRQTLALTLQKAGYEVLLATDGYEAIEQLQYHTDIDLIFCDIEMPRMNGFEFLKTRQQHPSFGEIPVVMLTSRSSEKHRSLALNLGANAYITKPYLEHMLLTTLKDVLDKDVGV
jgi:chemotaxis family two-component system sensor histidine kinase/response regulator PixL